MEFIRRTQWRAAGLALVAVLWAAGCSHEETTKNLTAEERYELGMKKFAEGNYDGAIEDFKVITLQFQGTSVADKAQFYMGECRFQRGEYILAAYEYEMLIRTMPTSPLVARARFQRATCYDRLSPKYFLDQDYTHKAIDEYQAFLEYFPTDSLVSAAEARITALNAKLAQKMFENGMTYLKLEYYRAATYYFDLVLEKYHDTPFAEPALLRKAQALTMRKRYDEAREQLARFAERYPDSTLKSEADDLRKEIDAQTAALQKAAQKRVSVRPDSTPEQSQ